MAELSLSTEIVNNVVEVLKKHDPATSDHLVASQYLAAIIGLLFGKSHAVYCYFIKFIIQI